MTFEGARRAIVGNQGGVLFDTNVLLLFLMMEVDPSYVMQWKRTRQFTDRHMQALADILRSQPRMTTTPHILTEVTNLADSLPAKAQSRFMATVATYAKRARERWRSAALLASDETFVRLGLADIGQLHLPRRGRPTVVTVDGPLYVELEKRRLPALNLNHYAF
jgi:hypothetical protein